VIEMVLLALEPVIVFLKSIKVEAINLADILAPRNLHQDLTQAQGSIQTQAQLKQVLVALVDPLQMALVYHRHP
jgi:hypothetical protein